MDNYTKIEKIGEGKLYGRIPCQVVLCITSVGIHIYQSFLGSDLAALSVTYNFIYPLFL